MEPGTSRRATRRRKKSTRPELVPSRVSVETGHRLAPAHEPRVLIGWNEYADLPEWGIRGLRAKVDTGARNSALHVENVEELPRGRVRFQVVLHRGHRDRRVSVETRIARRGRVRSSSGHYTSRIFVTTRLQLGPIERSIELSLVDREKMIFRMLLGRSALAGPLWIDVGHRALLGRRTRRKKLRQGDGSGSPHT